MAANELSKKAGKMSASANIFISYARPDHPRVKQLAAGLERAGYAVWWDRRIGGGAEFAREIEAALKAADVVLVAWSANSIDSHWVRDEAAAGRDTGRLLPVSLDGSAPPLGFRQFQTMDLSRWNGRASASQFQDLLGALGSRDAGQGSAERPSPSVSVRRLAPVSAGLALAAVAVAVGVLYWPTPSEALAAPELEIGTVQQLSGKVDPQLVPQLRQELRTALATDNAIAVTSAEGSEARKARFGLTATVNRSADTLQVAVELADRESGITLWSKILDIPAAQSDLAPRQVAYRVGTIVRCALSSRSKELEAAALAHWTSWCEELWGNPNVTLDRRLAAARKATEAAPNFSEAWSARAMIAAPLPGDAAGGAAKALRREAADAAERALRLDPANGEAYAAKAFMLPDHDFAGREALLKKSISVRPTDCVCQEVFYAQFLMSLGRVEEAYDHFRRVHEMRPLSPIGSNGMAYALFLLGRDEDAREVLTEARELWPDDQGLKMMQLRSSIWTGEYDKALALLKDPDFKVAQPRREPWVVGLKALESRDPAQRQRAVEVLVTASKKPDWNNMVIISTLAALGARVEALNAARRFIGKHGRSWSMVLFEPTFAQVRETPEFEGLVQQLGMSRYWAQSGEGPDFCESGAGPAVCRSA